MKALITSLFVLSVASAFGQCHACPGEAKLEAKTQSSCSGKMAKSCGEEDFLAMAAQMAQDAEGKGDNCCKSTEAKVIKKGAKGCCNETGIAAKFKVMVAGNYKYFGCKDSAAKARKELMVKGVRVGKVQAVTSSRTKIS